MIRVPIQTQDMQRRGVLQWHAGEVVLEQGSLTDEELEAVRTTMHEQHRLRSSDAINEGDPEPEPDQFLQGPGETPEDFMFHASFLVVGAGCLLVYDEITGDEDELSRVFG